jgi:hypothetical protein
VIITYKGAGLLAKRAHIYQQEKELAVEMHLLIKKTYRKERNRKLS